MSSYEIYEDWAKELGIKKAYLFSILQKLSEEKAFFQRSNQFLADKMNLSPKSIERLLKELEDDKWIFRNTYSIHTGSLRFIVTKHRCLEYWKKRLDKPSVPEELKTRFLKHFSWEGSG